MYRYRHAPLSNALLLLGAFVLVACGAKDASTVLPAATPEAAPAEDAPSPDAAQPALRPDRPPGPGERRTFACIEFVWVPPGTFEMGSAMTPREVYEKFEGDLKWYAAEHPRHTVTISKGFWIGRCEVAQAQWVAVMGDNPSKQKGNDLPVGGISWEDCQGFIQKLNALGQGTFRLPAEAEWEYACRAGTATEFCYGDSKAQLSKYGWHFRNSGYKLHPVGQKEPNAWGLYDMHGNAWEWCQDWYDAEYYQGSPEIDPQGPETGEFRVLRGGTAKRTEPKCRSAFRSRNNPAFRTPNQSLRLVREAD